MSINNIGLFKAFAPAVKTTKPQEVQVNSQQSIFSSKMKSPVKVPDITTDIVKPPKYPTGKFPPDVVTKQPVEDIVKPPKYPTGKFPPDVVTKQPVEDIVKPPKYPTGKFPLGLLDTDAKGKDPYSKKLY